ncbi:Cohesin subunit SA-1 [Hypsibius exemplaris]|uniref:Cohesin subunit SA-1 n=1 Tax=Hypsibius exemplaris TaxID=2072580 RepID=A0A9X6NDA5_HYPEX|nr:Cohesin subunit SA-1 [Hypsibius exemplaris]
MDTSEGSLSLGSRPSQAFSEGFSGRVSVLEEGNVTVQSIDQSWTGSLSQHQLPSAPSSLPNSSWTNEPSSVAVEHRNGSATYASEQSEADEAPTGTPTGTPATPVGRPKRAAATVATERMTLRPKTPKTAPTAALIAAPTSPESPPTPDDNTSDGGGDAGRDSLQSPVRKRRRNRKSDPTFSVNETAQPENVTLSAVKAPREPRNNKAATFRTPVISRKKAIRKTPVSSVAGDNVQIRNLSAALRQGEEPVDKILDGWAEVYKNDRLRGYLEMANFFIHASGCQGKITFAMSNLDHAEVIKQLTGKFDEENNDYPIIKPGPEFRKFRSDFCKFLDLFVKNTKDSILVDDYLMENLTGLLSELSDSAFRAFRHTATLGALKMMTSLVEVQAQLKETIASDERQLELEKKRNRANKPRLQTLQDTFDQHTRNAESIKSIFDKLFKSVFGQRYRDSLLAVRELCMEELGEWMITYPSRFVDDSYLKYLGWTLNDKEATVRRKVLNVILPLVEKEDLTQQMQLFSSKFKDRFVEMTADADPECCVKAVKIVCALDKTQTELFAESDLDRMFELIYVSDRNMAVAASDFLLTRMAAISATDPDRKKGRRFRSGKEWSEDVWNIFEILKFSTESPTHSHTAYLVDSLIDSCSALKAWDAMTDLLLEETEEGQPSLLDDKFERTLIEIMCFALKHAAVGESPTGRISSKKTKAKDLKQVQDDRARLTTHFITTLPPVLTKFKQDVNKTGLLISVPQYFDVDIYTTNHKEEELDQLLDIIGELFAKYEDAVFLRNCAKSLESLEQEGTGIVNRVAMHKSGLIEAVTTRFHESLPVWMAGGSEAAVYEFESSVTRLVALFNFFDLTATAELWDDLMTVMRRGFDPESTMKRPLLRKILSCCNLFVMWRIQALRKHEGVTHPDADDCAIHMARLRELVGLLMPVLTVGQTASDTVFAVYHVLLDLLVLHPAPLSTAAEWEFDLKFELPSVDQQAIAEFVEFQVFTNVLPETTSPEARLTHVHRRRQVLTQFCRAFTCDVISSRFAELVLRHYLTTTGDYSDVIKEAVRKMMEVSKVHCAEAVAAALIALFTKNIRSHKRNSQEILEIREMAKKLALLFGTDNEKSRWAMGALHKYCVEFIREATDDRDLAKRVLFFDVLSEFTSKLRREDKARLVGRLNSLPNLLALNGDVVTPFFQYRNSLTSSGTDTDDPADKHRRGRRVNPVIPKHRAAALRLPTPTPDKDDVASVVASMASSVAGDAPDAEADEPGDIAADVSME